MPQRIQRSRKRGWRKPPNTECISRPSKFGNPFAIDEYGRERAIKMFEDWILAPEQASLLDEARRTLRGKNLCCWCRLGLACHADVLLELVNR